MGDSFRIVDLARLAALALEEAAFGQNSGRVREVPDVRTIRYYTTLGLIDRPLEMQGRTAWYGPRHLLQLLSVKRLQAEGHSLTEIQQTLGGADDATLHRIAGLSQWQLKEFERRHREEPRHAPSSARGPDRHRSSRTFWTEQPRVNSDTATPAHSEPVSTAAVLRLAPGVSLILDGIDAGQLDDRAVSSLQPEFERLIQALHATGLTSSMNHNLKETAR